MYICLHFMWWVCYYLDSYNISINSNFIQTSEITISYSNYFGLKRIEKRVAIIKYSVFFLDPCTTEKWLQINWERIKSTKT